MLDYCSVIVHIPPTYEYNVELPLWKMEDTRHFNLQMAVEVMGVPSYSVRRLGEESEYTMRSLLWQFRFFDYNQFTYLHH